MNEIRLDNSYVVSNKKGIDNGHQLDLNTTHVYIPFWCFYYKVHLSLPNGKDSLTFQILFKALLTACFQEVHSPGILLTVLLPSNNCLGILSSTYENNMVTYLIGRVIVK